MTAPPPSASTTEPIRLRQICLVARDLYALVDDLRAVLGVEVCHGKADLTRYGVPYEPPPAHSAAFFAQYGVVNAMLPVGDTFLEVIAPLRDDVPAARYLARRGGDAGYMFITEVEDVEPFRVRAQANNFRIAGGADYPQYRDVQLDPRDVGGTLLTFSVQREGRPFDGGWYPAGPHWRAAVRPGATAITGAEIACKDPAAVARRWSAVTGRAAEPWGTGLRIALDRSEIRFAPVADGQGDRLSVVDLAGAHREGIIAAARARGLPMHGDGVALGGVAFRLI